MDSGDEDRGIKAVMKKIVMKKVVVTEMAVGNKRMI